MLGRYAASIDVKIVFYSSLCYSYVSVGTLRIYKLKAFARFQRREGITDVGLAKAVRSAEEGLVDADLGGGLNKQRVARAGQGKSGGYRTVLAFRHGERSVFLYGFAKSERANIDDDELEALRDIARTYLALDVKKIEAAIAAGELLEVGYGEKE